MNIAFFKPALTLSAIVAIISALIIIVYNVTNVETSDILTDKQKTAIVSIYGGSSDDYKVVSAEDWQPLLMLSDTVLPASSSGEIQKVIRSEIDGSVAFDIVVKGYKNGFDIMVGVKDNAVTGVAIVSYGEETPGLGANNKDEPRLLEELKGRSGAVVISKSPKGDEVQAMTSATFSSKGIAKAVNTALWAYGMVNENTVSTVSTEKGGDDK